ARHALEQYHVLVNQQGLVTLQHLQQGEGVILRREPPVDLADVRQEKRRSGGIVTVKFRVAAHDHFGRGAKVDGHRPRGVIQIIEQNHTRQITKLIYGGVANRFFDLRQDRRRAVLLNPGVQGSPTRRPVGQFREISANPVQRPLKGAPQRGVAGIIYVVLLHLAGADRADEDDSHWHRGETVHVEVRPQYANPPRAGRHRIFRTAPGQGEFVGQEEQR